MRERTFAGAVDLRDRVVHAGRVAYDRHITTRRLPEGRDLLLATNRATAVTPGEAARPPLDYVASEVERMVKGKNVLILAYSGRNHPHEDPHFPHDGRDFDRAAELSVQTLARYGPNNYVFLHRADDPERAIKDAGAIYVAGGNSSGYSANLFGRRNFDGSPIDNEAGANTRPLHMLIRGQVAKETPYIGVSAGQMVATGNVIPHLDPPAHIQIERTMMGEIRMSMPFDGLNLLQNLGLCIHPHYNPDRLTNYGDSETQFKRVMQILERNPWLTVIGMPDNTALQVNGRLMKLVGDDDATASVMTLDREQGLILTEEISRGEDLSDLLDTDLRLPPARRFAR